MQPCPRGEMWHGSCERSHRFVYVAPQDSGRRRRRRRQGADAYLTHPVEPDELLATVKALLRIRQAEAEARESQARYRRLVDTALEGVWTIDAGACTTYVNRQMAVMLGYDADEMLGRSFY